MKHKLNYIELALGVRVFVVAPHTMPLILSEYKFTTKIKEKIMNFRGVHNT